MTPSNFCSVFTTGEGLLNIPSTNFPILGCTIPAISYDALLPVGCTNVSTAKEKEESVPRELQQGEKKIAQYTGKFVPNDDEPMSDAVMEEFNIKFMTD